jgi:L-ascorbate metabolism protein UlaG (beta-lactamase superfamily)
MKFTYYGHSCFGIAINGANLLFDPFISYNPLAAHVAIDSIPADYILVSHGHQDHVADAVSIAKRTGATIICSWELMEWFAKQGVEKLHPLNTGGKKTFAFGTVRCVVAQHSSGLPDGSYGGNPMGFVVTTGEGNFYYAGDTALTLDMQLIPRWTTIDFAVLPIGDNFTMGADDAAMAANMVQTEKVIGVHFDTFPYIVIDKHHAQKVFHDHQIELILPTIGESFSI